MQCDYFDAGACRSCTLMGTPYDRQLADTQAAAVATLAAAGATGLKWLAPHPSRESGFRNKAKLVVGGRRGAPTLGILGADQRGVDLRHCGLHEPGLAESLPVLADLIAEIGLTPYDVATRNGELKHLIVTHSPDGELMARFVLRSPGQLPRLTRHLPDLTAALPRLRVVTANLHPEHVATLEGEHEVVLTDESLLPLRLNDVTLLLGPRSFAQTNSEVAAALYRTARAWVGERAPASLWDLYCGIGGFALHTADSHRSITGIEISAEAVEAATRAASALGARASDVRFVHGDATAPIDAPDPDLVVVNPPRRGIGPELAAWLEASPASAVLYSSCNPTSLARDLAAMPSLRAERAQLFDMFPQTGHAEVLVLLTR